MEQNLKNKIEEIIGYIDKMKEVDPKAHSFWIQKIEYLYDDLKSDLNQAIRWKSFKD